MMKRLILTFAICGMLINLGAQNCDTNFFPAGNQYYDTYHHVAGSLANWAHYNTHDPTVIKDGEWYYMYSTDASWAGLNKNGAMKRRSKDLVNWEYLGNAFNGVPQSAQNFFKTTISGVANSGKNPSYTDQGIWAPYLFKFKDKYFLYYSAPGGLSNTNYAYIGYATNDSAGGVWEDQGMITSSYSNTDKINAIDPSVIYDSINKKLWMAYGSWFTGIYILELDTNTGGIKTVGDRGTLICNRAATNYGQEGPELNYRNGWYYLFVSYDGLGDLYNVRVGRSRTPEGPYYDFLGKNMAGKTNNVPMIQAPYRFNGHPGWQGTGHCAVYNDNGKYYMFNQGRPSIEPAMMVLHVREMFWINDWPVLSPERYAGVEQCSITVDSLIGKWEHMPLNYHNNASVEYRSTSTALELSIDGTFNSNVLNTWTYSNDTLILNWANGDAQKLVVFWGWDWENGCKTILYSGLNSNGICFWGKKINQEVYDRLNVLVDGATYTIRNACSHLIMNVTNSADAIGAGISQVNHTGLSSQQWKIKNTGDGYYYMSPQNSAKNLVLEVKKGSSANGTLLILDTINGTNRQKFKLTYKNGYYTIFTKASNDKSCFDVTGSSTVEGAIIFQWASLSGVNQYWRFEQIDSVAVDTVSADTFKLPQYVLSVSTSGNGSVAISPETIHDSSEVVTLTAVPDENNIFASWSGSLTDTTETIQVIMNGDKTLTAKFKVYSGIGSIDFSSINIYPNPSLDGNITIDASSLGNFNTISISIIDIRGNVVYNAPINEPSIKNLDADLPKGIYIIQINSNTNQYFEKLIVQ